MPTKGMIEVRWKDSKGQHKIEFPDRYFEVDVSDSILKIRRDGFLGIVVQTSCAMDIEIMGENTVKIVSNWNEKIDDRKADIGFIDWEI